ncbi:sigma-70 family RNA polymerase sigma factor [Pendulispora rubella]|uniref:Sigma-70 family RNA polymerase sigma factor n=1 Tax=Pendulispora rubella TaxID=2741070 RepID=A0ABZ2LHX6_9BACT
MRTSYADPQDSKSARTPPTSGFGPRIVSNDERMIAGLCAGDVDARARFFDLYAGDVRRILLRVLGSDVELADLVQEVFLRAMTGIERLDDPSTLRSWLTGIAVFTARECIRRRQRRRWLVFLPNESLPEPEPGPAGDADASEALTATYRILARMGVDERIAFTLRFIDGMELTQVAEACDTSVSTIKRRLAAAEKRFLAHARQHPALAEWIRRGRWSDE